MIIDEDNWDDVGRKQKEKEDGVVTIVRKSWLITNIAKGKQSYDNARREREREQQRGGERDRDIDGGYISRFQTGDLNVGINLQLHNSITHKNDKERKKRREKTLYDLGENADVWRAL